MKIYEKPSVEIKRFDVEDIITASGEPTTAANSSNFANTTELETITGKAGATGVVFEW